MRSARHLYRVLRVHAFVTRTSYAYIPTFPPSMQKHPTHEHKHQMTWPDPKASAQDPQRCPPVNPPPLLKSHAQPPMLPVCAHPPDRPRDADRRAPSASCGGGVQPGVWPPLFSGVTSPGAGMARGPNALATGPGERCRRKALVAPPVPSATSCPTLSSFCARQHAPGSNIGNAAPRPRFA